MGTGGQDWKAAAYRGPRHRYPVEEREVVKQEGISEGSCAEDLTEPRAF